MTSDEVVQDSGLFSTRESSVVAARTVLGRMTSWKERDCFKFCVSDRDDHLAKIIRGFCEGHSRSLSQGMDKNEEMPQQTDVFGI